MLRLKKAFILASAAVGLTLGLQSVSQAAVVLADHDDWKVSMGGFVEMDMIHDSTRGFGEIVGNTAVPKGGTFNGENGRTAFSGRNSRLAFAVVPPVQNDWKTKGYLETDFLGYEPNVGTGSPAVSEGGFYSNPAIRIRHLYLNATKDDLTLLGGQTWSLFGWQPNYVLSTISLAPGPGILFQRTEQFAIMKVSKFGDDNQLQSALSIERPSQRDGETPNVALGFRYSYAGRKSGFAGPYGDVSAESLSVAISGVAKSFEAAQSTTQMNAKDHANATAGAIDFLIPILASSDGKDTGNTLSWTGEYSAGTGYADALPGWSGGVAQLTGATPTGTQPAGTATNLDPGMGGFDANNSNAFTLVKLQTWSSQLQYHFAGENATFITLGHSELNSSNVGDLTAAASAYNKTENSFLNVFHDFTKQIRLGAEYQHLVTTWLATATADSVKPVNDRYQLSATFRF